MFYAIFSLPPGKNMVYYKIDTNFLGAYYEIRNHIQKKVEQCGSGIRLYLSLLPGADDR